MGPSPPEVVTDYPPLDEEYFEWIDVLESVSLAQDRYTMLELGAGYGRWAVRAAAAAKQRGITCYLLAVEAEPVHFKWLKQHFSDNGLNPDEHALIQGVVTETPGETLFYVGMPDGGQDSAAQWYGQAIAQSYEILAKKTDTVHEGFRVFRHSSGWKSIKVPALTLGSLTRDLDRIDLIDMDVQGEELKIVRSSIDELDRKVKRLHIGTHSHEIEDGLRSTLRRRGWNCQFDFPCLSKSETPWGPVDFADGVQSWRNLKLQV
jgi:FkbM family methyltransferase